MRNSTSTWLTLLAVSVAVVGAGAALACAKKPAETAGASEYTCPMHPDVKSDKPGECPICGMDLVPRTELGETAKTAAAGDPAGATSETAAAGAYHCPMHPDVTSDKPGECPVCGMDLVPSEKTGEEHGPGGM